MLEKFIPLLIKDLELGDVSLETPVAGVYKLPLEDELILTMTDQANGFSLKCLVAQFPQKNEELFSTQALLGNLFGQGTRGAILGLTQDGNTLTLNQTIDYAIDFKGFKEIIEDFINTIDFWKDEALVHNQNQIS